MAPVTAAVFLIPSVALPVSTPIFATFRTAIMPPFLLPLPARLVIVAVAILNYLYLRLHFQPRGRDRGRRCRRKGGEAYHHRYCSGAHSLDCIFHFHPFELISDIAPLGMNSM
ncbi:hypothetical protein [Pararhizobium sp. DWP3-4]|uniref:hypothetical protein n=1 Tax=Pararhizobium sp. DWP3-4 TaxID=2804565 RepID=UPI003CECFD1E